MEGLQVIISPTQSAFFAGEQFSAVITFTNPNQPTPTSNLYNKPINKRSIPSSAIVIGNNNNSEWSKVQEDTLRTGGIRQSSITSISSDASNLPEYSTSYMNTEDFPPSPFFGGTPTLSSTSTLVDSNTNLSIPNHRESIVSTTSGGALRTPHSASFSSQQLQQLNNNNPRSVSTNSLNRLTTTSISNSSKSTPPLPTRKGLIGKPLRTSITTSLTRSISNDDLLTTSGSRRNSNSSGLYGGLRRPGGAGGNHGKAQSMAVSSPDLLLGATSSNTFPSRNGTPPNSGNALSKSHGKSRLGGSLGGGEALAELLENQVRKSSGLPLSIIEEPASPNPNPSSPLPSFTSPSLNPNPILSFSSPPIRNTPQSSSPYAPPPPPLSGNRNRSYSSTLNDSQNPSDSSLSLHEEDEEDEREGRGGEKSFYGVKSDSMESLVRDDLDEQTRKAMGGGEIEGGGNNKNNDSTSTIADYYYNKENNEEDPYRNPNNINLPSSTSSVYDPYRPVTLPPPPHSAPPLPRNSLPSSSLSKLTSSTHYNPSTTFLHPPKTLTLLWSFAHLEGTFETEPSLIKSTEFQQLKSGLYSPFVPGSGLGGGTLPNEEAILKNANGGGHSGWRDWIWGGSPALGSSQGATGGGGGGMNSTPVIGSGATLEERKKDRMKEKSVPTFSCPPSILGVDLVLRPGESKSYNFSIRIPADLPPSFRGKSIKFSYHLVVGTNRASLGGNLRGPARDSLSRVMRVPIRVYNHVAVTGARPFYDLTNPIVYHRDEATTKGVDDLATTTTITSTTNKKHSNLIKPDTGREDFSTYATTLLDSILSNPLPPNTPGGGYIPEEGDTRSSTPIIMESTPDLRPEMRSRSGIEGGSLNLKKENTSGGGSGAVFGVEEEGEGCKGAVEIVSRNSQKVSYDINKDGFMVASLTLVKSAYRLGETVNGSVILNAGDGRVLRVSARLETHELIETSISTKSAPQIRQITRRLHSEYHETTLDSARVGFALAIPSGATPDFATSGVKLQWSVRLSFLVIPPSPDSPLPPPPKKSTKTPNAVAGGHIPTPSPLRHGRSKSFAYGFEPAVPLTLPAAPSILPTGATHLMPVLGPLDTSISHTSYRAVPDLGFVPVVFTANTTIEEPGPGPLHRRVNGVGGNHRTSPSLSSMVAFSTPVLQEKSVVLVPAKVETVECSIPIKVYPGNTPFRPTVFKIAA